MYSVWVSMLVVCDVCGGLLLIDCGLWSGCGGFVCSVFGAFVLVGLICVFA